MLGSRPMRRPPLPLRALVALPLLALAADQTRAGLLCGPRAESCLEAAGQGRLALLGVVALVLHAAALAVLVARAASAAPGFLSVWALGTAAVWGSCGAQAALAAASGGGAALGGGWLGLLALGVAAGAALATLLRVAPAARRLARSLRPAAPRLRTPAAFASRPLQRSPMGASAARLRLTRGRAPPVAA